MAFTVNDLNDLLRILREQPEWLAEVRRVLLTDEMLTLPDLVRELVEAQRRTDERLAEFQQRIEQQMAEFQQRIEQQMAEFQQRIERQIVEFQQRIEQQMAEFQQRIEQQIAEFQQRTDQRFIELAEAQRRTDERLAEFQQRTDQRFIELAEAQRRTDERLAEFQQRTDQRFIELAEAQRRTDERLAEFQQRTDQRFIELAEAQRRTDERLAEFQQRTEEQIGELKGTLLEMDYRAKVGAIFGSRLKKPKVVDAGDMWDVLRDRLDEEEIRQIVALDLIVRGRLLPPQGEGELWLAVEVSYVVDQNDVMRAAARAALLRKAGLPAIPVAAGKRLTQGASALATESRVVLVQDGSLVGWDDALQDATGERPSAA
jgi:hypothetical protein